MSLRAIAILGALGVLAGAFGAHALRDHVAPERLATWETAARYHLLTAVALLYVRTLPSPWPARLLYAGACVFAGSLYLLVLLDLPVLGAVTPVGGLLMIAGWLSLARAGLSPAVGSPR